jgi:hypothetical protein
LSKWSSPSRVLEIMLECELTRKLVGLSNFNSQLLVLGYWSEKF